MIGLLGSLLGSQGGRLLGGALGGRTGAMVGSFAGAMLGGRKIGRLVKGSKGKFSGGKDDGSQQQLAGEDLTDQDAEILIRSMVNAAKSDGSVDQSEIDAIMGELGEISEAEQQFLKSELAAPLLSPADLGRQVDKSLRTEAYVVSLMAITLDTDEEADYLRSLAAAIGLDEIECNEIHDQLEVERV